MKIPLGSHLRVIRRNQVRCVGRGMILSARRLPAFPAVSYFLKLIWPPGSDEFTLYIKVLFMTSQMQNLETLKDIKKIMERSSRFISLSGWSGIAAGICAVLGGVAAWYRIKAYYPAYGTASGALCPSCLTIDLMVIAAVVFAASCITAIFFTYLKTKKEGVAIWGSSARRLLWNTLLPMTCGAFVIWRLMELKQYDLVAPASLIFYGLALVNGSKYTIGEVRYLGYAEIVLGVINLWLSHAGLLCWTAGFGLFHIIYGVAMWLKYDRNAEQGL